MNNCTFCEELLKAIDDDEYFNHPHEYTVALVTRRYHEDVVCGQITHNSNPLNFCPLCGKKLNIDEIKKTIRERYREKK